jgi:hypothetical protein
MNFTFLIEQHDNVTDIIEDKVKLVVPEIKSVDNGIGPYEFWGQKCFDSQIDYELEFDNDEIIIPFNASTRLKKAIVKDFYACENYESFIEDVNFEVLSIEPHVCGFKIRVEYSI